MEKRCQGQRETDKPRRQSAPGVMGEERETRHVPRQQSQRQGTTGHTHTWCQGVPTIRCHGLGEKGWDTSGANKVEDKKRHTRCQSIRPTIRCHGQRKPMKTLSKRRIHLSVLRDGTQDLPVSWPRPFRDAFEL